MSAEGIERVIDRIMREPEFLEKIRESPARALIGYDLSPEERTLLDSLPALPFKDFEFHGFLGKRRTVSFGWRYDFNGGGFQKIEPMPDFLPTLLFPPAPPETAPAAGAAPAGAAPAGAPPAVGRPAVAPAPGAGANPGAPK